MSRAGGQTGFGNKRTRREVVDVPERKVEDKSLDKLLNVRKQRLDRLERERLEARNAWRVARAELRDFKQQWRTAVQDTKSFWEQARAEFFSLVTTSGQFRVAKAVYERMKAKATEMYIRCGESVENCKVMRTDFFDARRRVLEANRQQEKLQILRDEIRLLTVQSEM